MRYSNLLQVHALVKPDSGEFLGANTLEGFQGGLFFGADLPLLLRRIESVHAAWQHHCQQRQYLIRNPKPRLALPGGSVSPAYVVNPDNPPPDVHLVRYAMSVDKVTPFAGGPGDADA